MGTKRLLEGSDFRVVLFAFVFCTEDGADLVGTYGVEFGFRTVLRVVPF